jgi:hypothetical protein
MLRPSCSVAFLIILCIPSQSDTFSAKYSIQWVMDLECRKMGDLLEERQQEMAEILTKENGKPLAEAKVCF